MTRLSYGPDVDALQQICSNTKLAVAELIFFRFMAKKQARDTVAEIEQYYKAKDAELDRIKKKARASKPVDNESPGVTATTSGKYIEEIDFEDASPGYQLGNLIIDLDQIRRDEDMNTADKNGAIDDILSKMWLLRLDLEHYKKDSSCASRGPSRS